MKRILFLSLAFLGFYFAKAQIIYVTPSGAGAKPVLLGPMQQHR